ncbi:hypothetical protein [Nonomuraea ceibae]|uniref:hypothetical protein n=1 Tax=Nonomuraea ceibae TaxID=1935170 RepID=UPI001C5E9A8C|nr:hypothetical protein [Nonomuraea ceibae]
MKFTEDQNGPAVTIRLPSTLGNDAAVLSDWFDTLIWALHNLRSGAWDFERATPETRTHVDLAINDLETRLSPRLSGLRDALIRRHYELGGSHGELALALDVPRSTAQHRRRQLDPEPTAWERWATDGRPAPTTPTGSENPT